MVHRHRSIALSTRGSRVARRRDDEQGLILVFVVIMMAVLLGVLALVVDLGNARQQRRQAQTAADASALAGAEVVETFGPGFDGSPGQWTLVVQQVKGYAKQNFGVSAADWNGCSDASALAFKPDLGNGCISADFANWSAPLPGDPVNTVNRIRVRLPQRSIKTFFGAVLGANTLSTGATSMAAVIRTTHTISTPQEAVVEGGPCALCVLAETGKTLDGQNGDVTITGGGVVVNSSSHPAADLKNNGHVKITTPCDNSLPPKCNTIGGPHAGETGNFQGNGYSPPPVVKGHVDDPLAAVPQCGDGSPGSVPPAECPTTRISTGAKDLNFQLTPGIYENGIENSHTLAPGVYVLLKDITLNGNDQITGDGVTLFFACSQYPLPCNPGQTGAGIKTTGNGAKKAVDNGSLRLTAPTTGTYKGLTIFSDRKNTAVLTFRGNGSNESGPQSGSSGTIYAAAGTLDLRGNGYTLASMIIVNAFTMNGNPSAVTIAYDLDKNFKVETHYSLPPKIETSYSYDASGLCAIGSTCRPEA